MIQTQNNTEILASILSYDELRTLITLDAKKTYQNNLAAILSDTTIEPLQKFELMKKLEADFNLSINNNIGSLKTYKMYEKDGNYYLIEPPTKQVNTTPAGNKTTNFVNPYISGDKIQLAHDGKQSPVYIYTQAGAQNDAGEVIKFSKAVEDFMFNTLGKIRLDNFKGFPGISHPYWTKVI